MPPKILYKPRSKVIINDFSEFRTPEEMASNLFPIPQQTPLGPLRWVDKLAIFAVPLGLVSEQVVEDYLRGTIYWDYLAFAPMPRFSPRISTKDGLACIVVDS